MNIEGWPDTDPYPYRHVGIFTEPDEPKVDCDYVARDKEYAKTAIVDEIGDYAYIMRYPWQLINEQAREIKELKEHIKWLKNVGGEHLNQACGYDILFRYMAFDKRKAKAKRDRE